MFYNVIMLNLHMLQIFNRTHFMIPRVVRNCGFDVHENMLWNSMFLVAICSWILTILLTEINCTIHLKIFENIVHIALI